MAVCRYCNGVEGSNLIDYTFSHVCLSVTFYSHCSACQCAWGEGQGKG